MDKLRLGISSCLLGEKVRYDGGHKHDPWLTGTLGRYVELVPVCPEVELGLGIPREALRQVGEPAAPRLVTVRSGRDLTEPMQEWARQRVEALEREGLCGFIFKSKSPSSGMERVKVYDSKGMPHQVGVGLFARAFMAHFPLLPVEEEGRLHDPKLRENFIEAIFVLQRWRRLRADPSAAALIDFHARHKLLLLAHSTELYRLLGKRTAQLQADPFSNVLEEYQQLLMRAMRLPATRAKQVNVLQHLLGYFKRQLSADEKQEVLETIEAYRQGTLPLIVPVTLINHFVRKYDQPYLQQQYYLRPHPLELQLRNHV
ncbi:MAG: DUF523 and DUF1722 domain-containing protein [Desulfuromonadales bacterium]|nr:DUF523 and DUF1722 domain-containing protein [Desulfuromonadales bacterium]